MNVSCPISSKQVSVLFRGCLSILRLLAPQRARKPALEKRDRSFYEDKVLPAILVKVAADMQTRANKKKTELHRGTSHTRHDYSYEIWHFHLLWCHDVPWISLHLDLWLVQRHLALSIGYRADSIPVPETKQPTLEEMDIVFGSSGVAAADRERMAQINREIGLDSHLHGDQHSDDDKQGSGFEEKAVGHPSERTGHLR
jgi:hypothetical protein